MIIPIINAIIIIGNMSGNTIALYDQTHKALRIVKPTRRNDLLIVPSSVITSDSFGIQANIFSFMSGLDIYWILKL